MKKIYLRLAAITAGLASVLLAGGAGFTIKA